MTGVLSRKRWVSIGPIEPQLEQLPGDKLHIIVYVTGNEGIFRVGAALLCSYWDKRRAKKKKEKKLRCEHIKFNECLVAAILTIESDHNEWSVLERALVPYDETEGCSKLMHRHNTHKIALLSPSLM